MQRLVTIIARPVRFVSPKQCFSTQHPIPPELAVELHEKKFARCITLTFNRPAYMNVLSNGMTKSLIAKFKEWKKSPPFEMVVIRGADPRGEEADKQIKSFCAGPDLKQLYDAKQKGDNDLVNRFFREEYSLAYAMTNSKVITISFMDGVTSGVGSMLAAHSRFKVASDKTVWSLQESDYGFFCDMGATWVLSRLPGYIGMYLALTGAKITGKNVVAAGLATHYVPSEKLNDMEKALAKLPLRASSDATLVDNNIKAFEEPVNKSDATLDINKQREAIDRCFNKPSVDDIIKALEAENNDWARNSITAIKHASPTSIRLQHRLLKLGKEFTSLDEVLKLESRISDYFLDGKEIWEGIRANVIDKDNAPKWQPPTLPEVSDEIVNKILTFPAKREVVL